MLLTCVSNPTKQPNAHKIAQPFVPTEETLLKQELTNIHKSGKTVLIPDNMCRIHSHDTDKTEVCQGTTATFENEAGLLESCVT